MLRFLRNRKGQGTTEYIVILAIAVVLIMSFWPKIKEKLNRKVTEIGTGIDAAGR